MHCRSSHRRWLLAALLAALVSPSTAVAGISPDLDREVAIAVRDGQFQLVEVLPVRLGPDQLWQYINGGAETYLQYGFVELIERHYRSGEVTLTAVIYDMGSALNAFGIYQVESRSDQEDFGLGAASQGFPPHQWLLLKDRFYVKVESFKGEAAAELGKSLLELIAGALPGDDSLPDELSWLPQDGRVAGSNGFSASNYLGLAELGPCIHADYDFGESIHPAFLLLPGDAAVDSLWAGLSAKWESKQLEGRSALLREIPYKGLIGVIATPRGLLGVAGAESEKDLGRLLSKLAPADAADRRR